MQRMRRLSTCWSVAGRSRRHWRAILIALVAVLAAGAPVAASGSDGPAWVRILQRTTAPAGARGLGALAGSQTIDGLVALRPRDPAALASFAAAVTSPRSSSYRHYLAPGQFASEFGPTPQAIAAVKAVLQARGIHVTGVSGNGLLVKFSATAAQAQTAFDTRLERYQLAGGRIAFAPTADVSVPSALASDVQSVVGLDTTAALEARPLLGAAGHAAARTAAHPGSSGVGPTACAAAQTAASEYGGLTDQQIAYAYGVDGLYSAGEDGSGQTIDVFEGEPFSASDQLTFDSCYFGLGKALGMLSRIHVIPVDGGAQVGTGSGEAELDMDDVSALAPGARIDVYEGNPTIEGIVQTFGAIVQADNAKVITSSWFTACEAQGNATEPNLATLENTIFEQAAVQGQTVLEAAGDDGSDGCSYHGSSPAPPILSQSVEAAQPYVLSVGGTTITDATFPPAEQVWNDGADFGAGGGGLSAAWPAPAWQADSTVPGIGDTSVISEAESLTGSTFCGASLCREVPDVTAQADQFTGAVTVYESQYGGWTTFGGTSSATPLWAAMLVDIASTPACESAGGLGFVPPELYALASVPSEYAASFNDITAGNNDVFGDADGLFPATTGYDMASGLGSPKVTGPGGTNGLSYYLCDAGTPAASTIPTVAGVAPEAVSTAGGPVTISGTGFETSGDTPDVTGVQVGTVDLASGDFKVTGPDTIEATLPPASALVGAGASGDGAGTYDVTVTLSDGETSIPDTSARVTYFEASTGHSALPEVDGIEAPGGNEAGGMVVTVYGTGFAAASGTPTVTFGGVLATHVKVLSDSLLKVTVPAYSAAHTTCATDADPATDVCQVEVQVTTANGSSSESQILPEYSGPYTSTANYPTTPPAGQEDAPAATEFDYLPTPTVTSVSVTGGLASEAGGTVATITGTGLGALGIQWVDVGPYAEYSSYDANLEYASPTELVVALPAEAPSPGEVTEPITVQTEGSLNLGDIQRRAPSNAGSVTYAPTPTVTSLSVAGSSYDAGPATGGTEVTITGTGFGDADEVTFTDTGVYPLSDTTTFSLTSVTPTSVTFLTPSDNPGVDQVSVCNPVECSAPLPSGDTFTYFPVGDPQVSSVSPAKGFAGTKVTITGANLGFIQAVYFGTVQATTFANAPALLDSGSTGEVTATAPPGTAGTTVPIRVVTLESEVTGSGESPVNPDATFSYLRL